MRKEYEVKGKVWLWRHSGSSHTGVSSGSWHFVSVPKKQSAEIRKNFAPKTRGFGSLRVEVTIGKTNWNTSIFPDKQSGTYVLPLKAEVRRKENVANGDTITFSITVV